jgi:hypothetical protein
MHIALGASICLCLPAAQALQGPDYAHLPLDTIFPGPWESNIRAPFNKSHITPVKIFKAEGAVSGFETVLQDADASIEGIHWRVRPGGLVTFEFAESISGRYHSARCAK